MPARQDFESTTYIHISINDVLNCIFYLLLLTCFTLFYFPRAFTDYRNYVFVEMRIFGA